jgi:hypothetical protein
MGSLCAVTSATRAGTLCLFTIWQTSHLLSFAYFTKFSTTVGLELPVQAKLNPVSLRQGQPGRSYSGLATQARPARTVVEQTLPMLARDRISSRLRCPRRSRFLGIRSIRDCGLHGRTGHVAHLSFPAVGAWSDSPEELSRLASQLGNYGLNTAIGSVVCLYGFWILDENVKGWSTARPACAGRRVRRRRRHPLKSDGSLAKPSCLSAGISAQCRHEVVSP